jgi:archaellum component FlaC
MSEEKTKEMNGGRSFEERVFARFDALDNRLNDIESRFEKLEHQAERQAAETKPMWERALAEIMEVKNDVREVNERVGNVERKIDSLALDILQVRADQRRLDKRVDDIELRPS